MTAKALLIWLAASAMAIGSAAVAQSRGADGRAGKSIDGGVGGAGGRGGASDEEDDDDYSAPTQRPPPADLADEDDYSQPPVAAPRWTGRAPVPSTRGQNGADGASLGGGHGGKGGKGGASYQEMALTDASFGAFKKAATASIKACLKGNHFKTETCIERALDAMPAACNLNSAPGPVKKTFGQESSSSANASI